MTAVNAGVALDVTPATAKALARFWPKINKQDDGCWQWTAGSYADGYGGFHLDGRYIGAHRAAWFLLVGDVPDGLVLDHLCRNRRCVNPEHLEPVTSTENTARGVGVAAMNARKTHGPCGHPYDVFTPSGRRYCRSCRNAYILAHKRARFERLGVWNY